jgi:hypothetical protein
MLSANRSLTPLSGLSVFGGLARRFLLLIDTLFVSHTQSLSMRIFYHRTLLMETSKGAVGFLRILMILTPCNFGSLN